MISKLIILILTILILVILYLVLKKKETFSKNNNFYQNYRFADFFKSHLFEKEKQIFKKHINDYPNTLVDKYYKSIKNLPDEEKWSNFEVLYKILNLKPENKSGISLHLRVGDVILGYNENTKKFIIRTFPGKKHYYAFKPDLYNLICKDLKKMTNERTINLFYGSHNVYNKYSDMYIDAVKNIFKNHGFNVINKSTKNPDLDFELMANSKIFIRSGGGFSRIISTIVEKNNGQIIDYTNTLKS